MRVFANSTKRMLLAAMTMASWCGSPAIAADSCTNWLAQGGGVEWRQCVRDNGSRYCQERRGTTITNVRC